VKVAENIYIIIEASVQVKANTMGGRRGNIGAGSKVSGAAPDSVVGAIRRANEPHTRSPEDLAIFGAGVYPQEGVGWPYCGALNRAS
jgi:hypothetical protein